MIFKPCDLLHRGTMSFANIVSDTSWSTTSLSVSIRAAPCGHFDPEIHTENILYPPCATAEFRLKLGFVELEFQDPYARLERKYWFNIKLDAPCPVSLLDSF